MFIHSPGKPKIGIITTTRGGIIYEVELPVPVQHSVTLNLSYTNGDRIIPRNGPQPDEPFKNTRIITYRENTDRLPCMDCYVTVSLVAVMGNREFRGPNATSSVTIVQIGTFMRM